MRRAALHVVAGLFLYAVPALPAQQGTSSLAGKVTDAQGGVLPGVNVVVTNEDTGVFREVVSSAEGSFGVSQIVPGRYRVAAKLEGFKALDRRGVVLTVGETATIDLVLEVGGLAETLTVTGETPQFSQRPFQQRRSPCTDGMLTHRRPGSMLLTSS